MSERDVRDDRARSGRPGQDGPGGARPGQDGRGGVRPDPVVRAVVPEERVTEVMALLEAAAAHDEVAPLSEHSLLHLRHGRGSDQEGGDDDRRRSVLLSEHGSNTLIGYAHLDLAANSGAGPGAEDASGELVVHPDHRGQGHGRALLRAMQAEAGGPLRIWAHGDLPAARGLAASSGMERVRALWQMRRPLTGPASDGRSLPDVPPVADGVRIRTFEPGRDEAAWVRLNRAAFADHPEQGAWTVDDLVVREREPWFDPAGFFVAERDGRLIGFHWTKVHPDGVGEVYVVGVSPAAQGMGLGKVLTLTGLHHLRDHGRAEVMLYVDEDKPARGLYESLGFVRSNVDVMYLSPDRAGRPG